MNKILKQSINSHVKKEQLINCMGELGNLIFAIAKEERGYNMRAELVEQIANVSIVIEILEEIYNISEVEVKNEISEQKAFDTRDF